MNRVTYEREVRQEERDRLAYQEMVDSAEYQKLMWDLTQGEFE